MRHHPMHLAHRLSIAAAALALTALASSIAFAADAPAIQLLPGSRVWLEGNSTMHAYKAEAKRIDFAVTTTGGSPADGGGFEQKIRAGAVKSAVLSVPVAELYSEKAGLQKNMRSALKGDKHPTIKFTMGRYSVADADSLKLKATGTLSIAGVECPVDIVAQARRSGDVVILRGSEPLLMSDYGIKPPKMMMGAIKTADAVVVHFELRLAPMAASALGAAPRTNP